MPYELVSNLLYSLSEQKIYKYAQFDRYACMVKGCKSVVMLVGNVCTKAPNFEDHNHCYSKNADKIRMLEQQYDHYSRLLHSKVCSGCDECTDDSDDANDEDAQNGDDGDEAATFGERDDENPYDAQDIIFFDDAGDMTPANDGRNSVAVTSDNVGTMMPDDSDHDHDAERSPSSPTVAQRRNVSSGAASCSEGIN